MTILQPSALLIPYIGRPLPQHSDLTDLLEQLGTALLDSGLDGYERAYAQTWLTRLFIDCDDGDILDKAGELLSLTNPSVQKDTHRDREPYCFDSPNGQVKITIEESFMQNVHATGFQTWSSAVHLARRMLADPMQFFKTCNPVTPRRPIRVLELGSGTGLAGIAAYHALLHAADDAQLVLSDMDKPTLDTLRRNLCNNTTQASPKSVEVEVCHLDWSDTDVGLEAFDIILGADLVYEPEHADLLYGVVQKLLSKASSSTFHLVVVLRRTHGTDIAALETRFGDVSTNDPLSLAIRSREDIEAAEDDERQYMHRYYQIGWKTLRVS